MEIKEAKRQINVQLTILMAAKKHRCPDTMSDDYNDHLQALGDFYNNFEALMWMKHMSVDQTFEYCISEMIRIEKEDLERYPEYIIRPCPYNGKQCSVHKTGCGPCQIAEFYKVSPSEIPESWKQHLM